MLLIDGFFITLAYLLGSVASAIVVCRCLGLPDPRTGGSHNPGATNVLRLGGKKAAALTLTGDLLKGLIPVALAQLWASEAGVAATALAAFLGHLYPLYFQFQGGKGVATAFGGILGLQPWVAVIALGGWLLVAKLTRTSSLAALGAALLTPILAWWWGLPGVQWLTIIIMVALLVWRHRSNINRLLAGSEGTIGGS